MNYFFLNTKTFRYPIFLGDLHLLDPSISETADPFSITPPEDYVIVLVDQTIPEHDRFRESIVLGTPYKDNSTWKCKYIAKPRPIEPIIVSTQKTINELLQKWKYNKEEDDDSYFIRIEKQRYRKLLQEVPTQINYPFNVEWPLEPSTIPFFDELTHKPVRATKTENGSTIKTWELVPLTLEEKTLIRVDKFSEISMRQARLILLQEGLLAQVETAINNIQDETQKAAAKIEWEYSQTVKIDSPLLKIIAAVIGLTQEQVESLFEAGSKL